MSRPRIGYLTEPDDLERAAFLREVTLNALPLLARYRAAEDLSRAYDRAALASRYGIPMPESRALEIRELEAAWRANRLRGTTMLRH